MQTRRRNYKYAHPTPRLHSQTKHIQAFIISTIFGFLIAFSSHV